MPEPTTAANQVERVTILRSSLERYIRLQNAVSDYLFVLDQKEGFSFSVDHELESLRIALAKVEGAGEAASELESTPAARLEGK